MPKETIGEYLKRERELRQITLEEMVQGTKIALQRLKELESDRLEDMPAEIFVRGFIKSYAEFIGLNPDEVILRYEEELKALQEKEAAETGSLYNCSDMNPHSNVIGVIITVVVLFALAAAGYWFFLKSGISLTDIFSGAKEKAKVIRLELGESNPINKTVGVSVQGQNKSQDMGHVTYPVSRPDDNTNSQQGTGAVHESTLPKHITDHGPEDSGGE